MLELAAEIVRKEMKLRQESQWSTSTYAEDAEGPMVVEGGRQFWIVPWVKRFDLLECAGTKEVGRVKLRTRHSITA